MLLFVYGTLQRGHTNHAAHLPSATGIREAWTWGRLYHLPEGYPGLVLPESSVRQRGSEDLGGDAAATRALRSEEAGALEEGPLRGDWQRIGGEILWLPDPLVALPGLEELEGFRPDGTGLYGRALVPVWDADGVYLAWVYDMPPERPPALGGERCLPGIGGVVRWGTDAGIKNLS